MEKHEKVYRELKEKGYDGWGGKNYDNRMKGLDENLAKLLEVISIKSGKALELGSGAGDLSMKLQRLGFEVSGIEISQTAVEWAIKKSNASCRFVQGSVTDSNIFIDEAFDLILDGNCLHCLFDQDRIEFYRNVDRLLEQEGYLYIASVIANREGETAVIGPIPRCFLTEEQLLEELRLHHFVAIKTWVTHREHHGHLCGVFKRLEK